MSIEFMSNVYPFKFVFCVLNMERIRQKWGWICTHTQNIFWFFIKSLYLNIQKMPQHINFENKNQNHANWVHCPLKLAIIKVVLLHKYKLINSDYLSISMLKMCSFDVTKYVIYHWCTTFILVASDNSNRW